MFIVINIPPRSRYFCLRTGLPASDLGRCHVILIFVTLMCTLECLSECSVVSDSLWPTRTIALQAPLSMGFPRQDCWSGLPFPSPGDLSRLRDGTCVSCISCISRRILYHWATREVPKWKKRIRMFIEYLPCSWSRRLSPTILQTQILNSPVI